MARLDGTPPAEPANDLSAVRIIAGILLVLSVLFCVVVTAHELRFAHQATCGPEPPVAWRHTITFTGLAVYAAFAVPTSLLVWRGRGVGLLVAFALAGVALVTPALTFLVSAFSAAMC